MTKKYFGTDGIRGVANTEPMTASTAMRVAMAAAGLFKRGDYRHRVVIGKDTRLSGYMLEPALTSGFIAKGMDVILLGPVPTPAVSMLTKSLRADMGVMISASHNPYHDNGIKLFGPDGFKLSDELEQNIEERMEGDLSSDNANASDLGCASRMDDAVGRYVEYAKATYNGARLDGLRIVVDCANGAAYKAAPAVLWELGAEVILLSAAPNGKNINLNCGATDTKAMQEAVVTNKADLGIALDGDADRLIMADENGNTTTYAYSPTGELAKVVDALGNEAVYKYDACGRIIEVSQSAAEELELAPDEDDRRRCTDILCLQRHKSACIHVG